jgi:hypothetical protein
MKEPTPDQPLWIVEIDRVVIDISIPVPALGVVGLAAAAVGIGREEPSQVAAVVAVDGVVEAGRGIAGVGGYSRAAARRPANGISQLSKNTARGLLTVRRSAQARPLPGAEESHAPELPDWRRLQCQTLDSAPAMGDDASEARGAVRPASQLNRAGSRLRQEKTRRKSPDKKPP